MAQPSIGPEVLQALRVEYKCGLLEESSVDKDPLKQFEKWMNEAVKAQIKEPNSMCLSTASKEGKPSSRMVLMKGFDARGFTFFTNYESKKAKDLEENPYAALLFYWKELHRQVRVEGRVEKVNPEESEEYFTTRPVGAQVGAWASIQSSIIENRSVLEDKVREYEKKFQQEEGSTFKVPKPPHWGGYRVIPNSIEFWQGRESRLHDRIKFKRNQDSNDWVIVRLSP